jgi:cytidylate kinase
MRNVALSGRAGTGKSTLAGLLAQHYEYHTTSIATPIRTIATMSYGPFDKTKSYPMEQLGLSTFVSGRELLQNIGASLREMDSYFWMRAWERSLWTKGAEPWVVDDLRLDAEHEYIRRLFPDTLFVRLVRPDQRTDQAWQQDITERGAGDLPAALVLDTVALTEVECLQAIVEMARRENA